MQRHGITKPRARLPTQREYEQHCHYLYGQTAQSNGDYRSAFAQYRLEIRSTGYYKAYDALGGLLLDRRRFGDARDAFKAAVRGALQAGKKADAAACLTNLGITYEKLNQVSQAKTAWRRAATLNSADPRPLLNLGLRQLLEGDFSGGARTIARAQRCGAKNPLIGRWVGYAMVKYDLDVPNGLRLLESARTSQPRDATLLTDLSLGYGKLGRRADALGAIRLAARLEPKNADIRRQMVRLRTVGLDAK